VWNLYTDYLNDLLNKPMHRNELIKSGDRVGEQIAVRIDIPPTVLGFCIFANIDKSVYYDYLNGNNEKVTKEITNIFTRVDDDIKNKQITGATVNLYNGNIVSRLNGLTDNMNINTNEQPSININIAGLPMNLND
jgi:hypothetical protein